MARTPFRSDRPLVFGHAGRAVPAEWTRIDIMVSVFVVMSSKTFNILRLKNIRLYFLSCASMVALFCFRALALITVAHVF